MEAPPFELNMDTLPFIFVRKQIYYNSRKHKYYSEYQWNNNKEQKYSRRTTKYMEPQHQNNTFNDKKQCSLATSRGKPPTEQISITINLKTNPSHTFYSYLY